MSLPSTTDVTSGGAQRARMVLDFYDRSSHQAFADVVADLADYALEVGLDFELIAVIAYGRARTRRGLGVDTRPIPADALANDTTPYGYPIVIADEDADLYDVLEALEARGFGGPR